MIQVALWIASLLFLVWVGSFLLGALLSMFDSHSGHDKNGRPLSNQAVASIEAPTPQPTEEDVLQKKVLERKQHAQSLGVDNILFRLWEGGYFRLPGRLIEAGEGWVSFAEKAGETEVRFNIRENLFVVTWERRDFYFDGQNYFNCDLSLHQGDKVVLALDLSDQGNYESEYSYSDWRVSDVTAFLEGPWVSDFQGMFGAVQAFEQRAREAYAREQRDELEKKFGL